MVASGVHLAALSPFSDALRVFLRVLLDAVEDIVADLPDISTQGGFDAIRPGKGYRPGGDLHNILDSRRVNIRGGVAPNVHKLPKAR